MELLTYILKSATILTLFYLVYYIALRKDTFFSTNRYFLIGGIIASLLLPLLIFTKTVYIDIPIASSLSINNTISSSGNISQNNSSIMKWWQIGLTIYFIGVIFMGFRFLKQFFSLFTLLLNNSTYKSNGYIYVNVNTDTSPFSFFKYIVYNPELHTPSDLKMILKHEQTHASQLHSIDIILSNLLLIVQWINPFAWFYKKSIEENLEFIADNETVQVVNSKKEYQLTLLKVISPNTLQPVLANNFYQSLIKKRIIMLQKSASKTQNQWKFLIILPLLGMFLWSFNVEEEVKYNYASTKSISKSSSNEKASISTNSEKENNTFILNKITVSVDKNTSDTELDKLKKMFKDLYQVTLKFNGIQRNSAGEIIKIKVSMKSEKSSSNFNINDKNGINEFKISYDDKNNSISIGNNDYPKLHSNSKDGTAFIYKIDENKKGNVRKWISKDNHKAKKEKHKYIIHKGDDDSDIHVIDIKSDSTNTSNVWITENEDGTILKKVSKRVIIENDGDENESIFIINSDTDKDSIFVQKDNQVLFLDSEDKDLLIYINGKKSTKEKLEKLKSNGTIKKIELIKGDNAIDKYGTEAKDGVLLITTKK